MASSSTLYEIAHGEMCRCIDVYLKLTEQSTSLVALRPEHLANERGRLIVMANVFDYVVPIGRIDELVQCIEAYLDGDRSRLKWFIDFRIRPASDRN